MAKETNYILVNTDPLLYKVKLFDTETAAAIDALLEEGISLEGEPDVTALFKRMLPNMSIVPLSKLRIHELALLVRGDWKRVAPSAEPYLGAMRSISNVEEMYGQDSTKTVITYFLANAGTWRGDVARGVKAELKKRIEA